MRLPAPPLLARRSSDEYRPLPYRDADREALARLGDRIRAIARDVGLAPPAYLTDRRGTAATLRAVDAAAGGGFYPLDAETELDADAAAAAFDGGVSSPVVDVQTHLVNPDRFHGPGAHALSAFLASTDPDRWGDGVDPQRIGAAAWATQVFGRSETAVAVLTSTPGREHENVLTNAEIAAHREVVRRYAGSGRVLTHTIVHPNAGELDSMAAWRAELDPSAWKVYTLWDPPEAVGPDRPPRGWFLDDPVGEAFLARVRELGPRVVAAHKGIGGPVPGVAPAGASPRDVGPAAAANPDITFLVYHSGYDPDPVGEEGPYRPENADRGVNRLVRSVEEAGVGPGDNVYAELGTTWFLMLRRPREAAHVLGKLLLALGPERILWGTDSIWYGSPQPLIDAFRAFAIPERMQEEFGYPPITSADKQRILSANAGEVYDVDIGTLDVDRTWVPDLAGALSHH